MSDAEPEQPTITESARDAARLGTGVLMKFADALHETIHYVAENAPRGDYDNKRDEAFCREMLGHLISIRNEAVRFSVDLNDILSTGLQDRSLRN